MNTTILKSLFVVGAVAAAMTGVTLAYFTDTETSTGNTFRAGTIDLKMNGQNPYSGAALKVFDNIRPSQTLDAVTMTFENVGINPGTLTFGYSYAENDQAVDGETTFEYSATNNIGMEMNENQFASLLYVVASTQDGCDNLQLLKNWADTNGDGKVTLHELADKGPATWYYMNPSGCAMTTDNILDPAQTTTIIVTFHMADAFTTETGSCSGSGAAYTGDMDDYTGAYCIYTGTVAWNVPQADGISATVDAELKQLT